MAAFLLSGPAASAGAEQMARGELLAAEALVNVNDSPTGATTWRISYATVTYAGQPTTATALVIAPNAMGRPQKLRKTVVWAHGTVGVVPDCAPSEKSGAATRLPGVEEILQRGWVLVAPDYVGLGPGRPHAYLDKSEAAAAAHDAVRAAQQVPDTFAGPHFVVWGHSQGGHAALAVALATSQAPDLVMKGAVAIAPPTDLVENTRTMAKLIRGVLTSMSMVSWPQTYGNSTASVVPFIDGINRVGRSCLNKKANWIDKLSTLFFLVRFTAVDMSAMPDWHPTLARNSIPHGRIDVPLLVTQGTNDDVVPATLTRRWVSKACKAGTAVTYIETHGGDHEGQARATLRQAIDWIADRFMGSPASNMCVVPAA